MRPKKKKQRKLALTYRMSSLNIILEDFDNCKLQLHIPKLLLGTKKKNTQDKTKQKLAVLCVRKQRQSVENTNFTRSELPQFQKQFIFH